MKTKRQKHDAICDGASGILRSYDVKSKSSDHQYDLANI